jgi:hypothetical protein
VTNPVAVQDAEYLALVAIDDPVECARRITVIARTRGNLDPRLAQLRKTRLREARIRDGRRVDWLAAAIGLGASGISRLASVKQAKTAEGAAA